MRARDEVLHRIFGFTQARDETHAGYVNFLISQVKKGASPAQTATLPQFLALPKDQQRQLGDWHREQLADKLTGFAPDQNLDRMARRFAAYHDLSGDDTLKQMSDARVQALEPVLGEDLTRQALGRKQAAPALDATDFAALARSIGVDPNPAPSDTLSKAQLGVIRSAADKVGTAANYFAAGMQDTFGSRIMYQVKRIQENADGTLRWRFFPDKRDIVQQGDLQADFGGKPRTIEIPLTRPKPGEHFHYAVMLSGYDETAPGTVVQIWTKANGQSEKKKKP
jgi:hypothetical protein